MNCFKTVLKILTALAAIAGIIYIIATYGDKIVAWAKDLLAKCPCKCKVDDCKCEGECECGCECECEAEEAAEEVVEATEEAEEVVAAEADFEG